MEDVEVAREKDRKEQASKIAKTKLDSSNSEQRLEINQIQKDQAQVIKELNEEL